jgi:uncharacterized membrane protein YuzA (DUF378 family)
MKVLEKVDSENRQLNTHMKAIGMIAFILLAIGGLNWLLVGFGFNLVDYLFGVGSVLSRIVYILVGLSTLWELFTYKWSGGAA